MGSHKMIGSHSLPTFSSKLNQTLTCSMHMFSELWLIKLTGMCYIKALCKTGSRMVKDPYIGRQGMRCKEVPCNIGHVEQRRVKNQISIMCAWLFTFIDNEKNYFAWNSIRIIEGSDNWGSNNRGSTVKAQGVLQLGWCLALTIRMELEAEHVWGGQVLSYSRRNGWLRMRHWEQARWHSPGKPRSLWFHPHAPDFLGEVLCQKVH